MFLSYCLSLRSISKSHYIYKLKSNVLFCNAIAIAQLHVPVLQSGISPKTRLE